MCVDVAVFIGYTLKSEERAWVSYVKLILVSSFVLTGWWRDVKKCQLYYIGACEISFNIYVLNQTWSFLLNVENTTVSTT